MCTAFKLGLTSIGCIKQGVFPHRFRGLCDGLVAYELQGICGALVSTHAAANALCRINYRGLLIFITCLWVVLKLKGIHWTALDAEPASLAGILVDFHLVVRRINALGMTQFVIGL